MQENKVTGWAGLSGFAGILMMIVGLFSIMQGFVALFSPEYYVVGASGLLVFDYTTWGIGHLVVGTLVGAVGIGLMAGSTWARVLGVIVASVSAVTQLAFMASFPLWSVLIIALDILIIYAIAVHGGELKEAQATMEEQPTERVRRAG